MSHVADSPKTAFSTAFQSVIPPSGRQISAASGRSHPLLRTRETWSAPNVHLAIVLPPLTTTSYDLSPLGTVIHRQPDWQRPNGARSRRSVSLYSVCHQTGRSLRKKQSVSPHSLPPNR